MKKQVEIIFQHGWAFDSSCWKGWMPHLQEKQEWNFSVQTPERGYFGKARAASPFADESQLKIAVVHSFGLHMLPKEILLAADVLVLAGSFEHFHRGTALETRRSKRAISLMQERLIEEPLDLLNDFYGNCYHPLLTSQMLLRRDTEYMDLELLAADLDRLDKEQFDMSIFSKSQKMLFVHGSEDQIVPIAHAIEMSEKLPGSSLVMFEGAGHSLPLTHVAPVWISLRNTLKHLLTVKA